MQTERFILKNVRVTHQANEYIVFNASNNTQTRFTDTPDVARDVMVKFNLKPISPIEAQFAGYFNFKHVKLNNYEN